MKWNGGQTLVVKTHGFTTGNVSSPTNTVSLWFLFQGSRPSYSYQQQLRYNHMDKLTGKAILLIRNPTSMLISHRNLDSGGHSGYAKPDMFKVNIYLIKLPFFLFPFFYFKQSRIYYHYRVNLGKGS